ncbi:DUF4136 domain-containing protein [Xanthocytophaga agilis]|uniref:DUF4136 domain-containing protein n=1 Tax=Xanthocytophaga agilis TaxID=3048010 RepID=A0AAE3R914_9BACT|nr:DUF4136 domain-containing protein [Xanthocytophaga agilis]MDJ1502958.1 DUF4136 domain-containing protein [Xanthocytophaga agilis]
MKTIKMRVVACIAFLSLFVMGGCASLVSTQVAPQASLGQYKTFGWLKPDVKVGSNPLYNSKLLDRNIQYALESELTKRGMVHTESQPDLLLQYHTYTEKKRQSYNGYNYYPYGGFYPFGWGRMYGWGMMPYYGNGYNRSYTYTEGTLVIDMIDAKTKELLWRGSIQGNVDNVKRLQQQVAKGVEAIMKKYPVPRLQDSQQNEKPIVS